MSTRAAAQNTQQSTTTPQPPAIQALARVETAQAAHALVPTSLEGAMQFSSWLAQSSLLPKSVNREHDIFFVVCAGMELGFPPMAALRSLYVVNGRTALEAKAKSALCLQRGAAMYFRKTEDTDKAVTWETHRLGAPGPAVSRFTIDDAKHAGLLNKEGPWKQYPRRMMSWKALGFLCDDTYPDIMLGVATKEDFDEEHITFRPITNVAPGIDLGTVPAKPPANEAAAASSPARADDPKAEVGSFAKQPNAATWTEDEIVEAITSIGKAGTHAELKKIKADIWGRGELDDATRQRFAKAYSEQWEMIADAIKRETQEGGRS